MSVSAALRHLVAWGLLGGPSEPIRLDDGASGLPAAADFHRVTGVVLAAIERGAAIGPPVLVDELRAAHLDQLRRAAWVEASLVAVCDLLRAAGIEHRVLKGGATAHLDHADPAERLTSDVDVLVRPGALGAASVAVVSMVDPARTVPDRRPSWVERYGKDRTLALRSGGDLDLHRMLAPGFHGLVDRHDWFRAGERFVVAGRELTALGRDDRFVHALAHAGYADARRLHSLRDVAVLLEAIGDRWVAAIDDHPHWEGLLARGVEVVWDELPLAEHPIRAWAAGVRPGRRERIALAARRLPGSRSHWSGVVAIPPWRWPGAVLPLAVPDRAYLARRGRTPAGHIRETARALLRSRRR